MLELQELSRGMYNENIVFNWHQRSVPVQYTCVCTSTLLLLLFERLGCLDDYTLEELS